MKQKKNKSKRKYNSLLRLIGLTTNCGLSAFYFGYCLTYFNAIPFRDIVKIYHLQSFPKATTEGLLTGCISFTGALGSIMSLLIVDRFSRRSCLSFMSFLAIILSLCIMVPNIWVLAVVRLLQGIVIGMISCITPLYINQMMPKSVSGPFWSYHQCLHVLGISFGFILTYLCSKVLDPSQYWRIIFGFPIITSIIQIFNFIYIYPQQSPKFLVMHDKEDKARQTLRFLYKQKYVDRVMQQIIEAVQYAQESDSQSQDQDININKSQIRTPLAQSLSLDRSIGIQLKQMPKTRKIRPLISLNQMLLLANKKQKQKQEHHSANNRVALYTALFLSIQQPFLGGPSVINYSGDLIEGVFPKLQNTFPIIINVTGIFGSLVSIYIMASFGRRDVILIGSATSGLFLFISFLLCLAINYQQPYAAPISIRVTLSLLFIMIRVILSATFAPVSDLFTAQIVQPNILSYCSLAQWMVTGVVTTFFPVVCDMGYGNPKFAFLLFALITCLSFFIDRSIVIQTKNKSQIQIRKQYDQKFPQTT